jgi:MYXO-CTERM domain-containing protein
MRLLIATLAFGGISLASSVAFADVDCPAGTKKKSEGTNEWCEPSVCLTDAQCLPGELCKPVPLCVEIGTVKGTATSPDGGQRLMARQKCGPDRSCPASTSCLDGLRCITKPEAEKMGMLSSAVPSASSAPAAEGKKCGCRVAGAPSPAAPSLLLASVAIAALAGRRRRR